MADVTGPISTLPGAVHAVPDGMMCDDHPDRPAVSRIQGETDSFGCEMNDLCQECLDQYREGMKNLDRSGVCDWCKQQKPRLSPTRDYDEGMCGRVYDVCAECRKKAYDEAREELALMDFDDDGRGDDD